MQVEISTSASSAASSPMRQHSVSDSADGASDRSFAGRSACCTLRGVAREALRIQTGMAMRGLSVPQL